MLLLLAAAGVASAQPPSPDGSFVADDVGSTPFGDCRPVAAWSRSGNKYTKICGMYGVELCGAPTAVSGIEYTPRCEWVATEPTTAAPASAGVAASKCALTRCADGYTCVEGKGCVLDAPRICCKAMNAQCLSCSAGVSVIDYCRKNPRTAGCPIIEPMCALIRCEAGTVCIEGKGCVKKPEPPVCCKAMTAQCLSCAAGVSIDEYCKENPRTAGCKTTTTPPRPCPVMDMLVCPNNVAPVCGEPTVLFPGCTLPSCKCPVSPCEAASRANLAALENTALAVHAQMQAMVADLKHVGVETAHLEAQSAALKRAIAAKGC